MGYQLQILRLSHTSDTHSLTVTLSEVEVFPEFLKKLKLYVTSVSLSVLEVFSINHVFDSNSITSKNRFHFNPNGK